MSLVAVSICASHSSRCSPPATRAAFCSAVGQPRSRPHLAIVFVDVFLQFAIEPGTKSFAGLDILRRQEGIHVRNDVLDAFLQSLGDSATEIAGPTDKELHGLG